MRTPHRRLASRHRYIRILPLARPRHTIRFRPIRGAWLPAPERPRWYRAAIFLAELCAILAVVCGIGALVCLIAAVGR